MKKLLFLLLPLIFLVSCTKKTTYDTFDHKIVKNSVEIYFITPDKSNQIKFINLYPYIKDIYLEDSKLKFLFNSGDILILSENLGLNAPFTRNSEVNIIVSPDNYSRILEIDRNIKNKSLISGGKNGKTI